MKSAFRRYYQLLFLSAIKIDLNFFTPWDIQKKDLGKIVLFVESNRISSFQN